MDLSDTPEEAAFRNQAREWLRANAPKGLVDRGFSWPVEYGGQGKTIVEDAIFNEELARSRAPGPLNLLGLSMGGPTILEHGAEEQKKRFLKKILTCEEIWCQGFSEPASGSDLAALQ